MAGCVSAPTPESTSKPWVPPAQSQEKDEVWAAVRAQKVDLTKPLALADLADLALKNNPDSRRAWQEARTAAEQVTHAQGYFLPQVTAVGSDSRLKTSATPTGFDTDYTKYGPGLQVNYLVLNFGGGRRAAVEEALQTVYAADFAFNKSLQDILLAVETSYYGMISAQAGIETAEAGVKDAQKILEVAEEQLKQGTGTKLDVLQAQATRDQALFSRASAEGLLKTVRGALAAAIGIPADTDVQLAAPTGNLPEAPAKPELQKLIDAGLQQRPDVAALRATLAAKQAAVKVADAAFWPSLYLNGSVNRDYYNTKSYDMIPSNTLQDKDWSYMGGISLQWTLFDGFQNVSEKRGAVAQYESAKAQLQQAELAAGADVWTRYHNYVTALEKVKFSAAVLESASASYDLALDSFKAQLIDIVNLLAAETQLSQARAQNVAARQDVFTALANLAYSTGVLEKDGSTKANVFSKGRMMNNEK